MEMTEGEIVRKYQKGVSIKVLAELNDAPKNTISRILESNGVKKRMGRPDGMTTEEYKEQEELEKKIYKLLPECVKVACFNQIDTLKKQIEAKQKELDELEEFIKGGNG